MNSSMIIHELIKHGPRLHLFTTLLVNVACTIIQTSSPTVATTPVSTTNLWCSTYICSLSSHNPTHNRTPTLPVSYSMPAGLFIDFIGLLGSPILLCSVGFLGILPVPLLPLIATGTGTNHIQMPTSDHASGPVFVPSPTAAAEAG
jgi:hypothetical protein